MVKINKIYTRTGDAGSSGLVDGSRLSKGDALFDAIGDVDEANGVLGLVRAALTPQESHIEAALDQRLSVIQNDLFDLGADLATPPRDGDAPFAPGEMELRIIASQVTRLEGEIDAMNATLSPLRSFILPSGGDAVSRLHLARSVVRRAERSAVKTAATRALNPAALSYINRLSDWLFVAARHIAQQHGGDVLWVPGASR